MKPARLAPRPLLVGLAALLMLVMLAMTLAGRSDGDRPASRAALERIAAKNREAAVVSAAHQKAESDAAAAAADARLDAQTQVAEAKGEADEPTR